MGRDGEQLATASKRFDLLTGDLGVDPGQVPGTDGLQAVADAAAALARAEDRMKATVEAARAHGRSWRQIGLVLGLSRQAARDRFGPQPAAKRKASRARRVMGQETAVLDRMALNQSTKKVRRPH